ncbi:MAG: hypothetical protein FH748_12830 [Balneolaceae bacterium]|nr:hypothetical protein [Balneolaceae bacterium]
MKTFLIALFLLTTLTITSCDEEDPPAKAQLRGVVNTADGQPVADAAIHIRNYLVPGGFTEPPSSGSTGFEFTVTEEGHFLIELYRYGSNRPLTTLVDEILQTGNHRITIADSLLTNGTYRYTITGTSQQSERYFLVNKPDSALLHTIPFERTNQDGEFTISIRNLALGEIFYDGKNSILIGDSLKILVQQGDTFTAMDSLKLSRQEDTFIELKSQQP